jgi:hypothetical protein
MLLKFVLILEVGLFCAWFIYHILCWCWCPDIVSSSIDWAQLSRFHLKTESESSLRNVMFFKYKYRTMDNVHKHINFIEISPQLFLKCYYLFLLFIYSNCKWVFTRWQWYYNNTHHTK